MPIFWYFISQLLVEISIWNSYRTLIGSLSIHWKTLTFIESRSKVKVTGTVHCFLNVQSYHKKWAMENFQYFFRHLFACPIKWNNKNLSEQRNDVTKKYANIWRLTCKTPIPQLILLIQSSNKIGKNMAVIQLRPTHILYQCAKCGDDRTSFNVICDVCDV